MDPAFLRRLPYKIEVGAPSLESLPPHLRDGVRQAGIRSAQRGVRGDRSQAEEEKGLDLAAYQPKFIVDQVVASCRFMQQPPAFEPRFVNHALDNLRVHRHSPATHAKVV